MSTTSYVKTIQIYNYRSVAHTIMDIVQLAKLPLTMCADITCMTHNLAKPLASWLIPTKTIGNIQKIIGNIGSASLFRAY